MKNEKIKFKSSVHNSNMWTSPSYSDNIAVILWNLKLRRKKFLNKVYKVISVLFILNSISLSEVMTKQHIDSVINKLKSRSF